MVYVRWYRETEQTREGRRGKRGKGRKGKERHRLALPLPLPHSLYIVAIIQRDDTASTALPPILLPSSDLNLLLPSRISVLWCPRMTPSLLLVLRRLPPAPGRPWINASASDRGRRNGRVAGVGVVPSLRRLRETVLVRVVMLLLLLLLVVRGGREMTLGGLVVESSVGSVRLLLLLLRVVLLLLLLLHVRRRVGEARVLVRVVGVGEVAGRGGLFDGWKRSVLGTAKRARRKEERSNAQEPSRRDRTADRSCSGGATFPSAGSCCRGSRAVSAAAAVAGGAEDASAVAAASSTERERARRAGATSFENRLGAADLADLAASPERRRGSCP
jgi:hypothetical protein